MMRLVQNPRENLAQVQEEGAGLHHVGLAAMCSKTFFGRKNQGHTLWKGCNIEHILPTQASVCVP